MAFSAEQKRVHRLLNDPEYGPMFVKLNRTNERTILELLEQNRGREARKQVVALYTAERERRNAARRAVRYVHKSNRAGKYRPDNESPIFWRIYDDLTAA